MSSSIDMRVHARAVASAVLRETHDVELDAFPPEVRERVIAAVVDAGRPPFTYACGERVIKDKGDYVFEGEVVAPFFKRSSAERVVVEDDRGLCFIFSPSQLRRKDV